jgi:hypothetical protein
MPGALTGRSSSPGNAGSGDPAYRRATAIILLWNTTRLPENQNARGGHCLLHSSLPAFPSRVDHSSLVERDLTRECRKAKHAGARHKAPLRPGERRVRSRGLQQMRCAIYRQGGDCTTESRRTPRGCLPPEPVSPCPPFCCRPGDLTGRSSRERRVADSLCWSYWRWS